MGSEEANKSRKENYKGEEPKVVVRGQEFRLDESQTRKFGVTKVELQGILLMLLRNAKSPQSSQRGLFNRLLVHMKITAVGDSRDELVKIYMENLRELKGQGKVEFESGKTHLNIRLVKHL